MYAPPKLNLLLYVFINFETFDPQDSRFTPTGFVDYLYRSTNKWSFTNLLSRGSLADHQLKVMLESSRNLPSSGPVKLEVRTPRWSSRLNESLSTRGRCNARCSKAILNFTARRYARRTPCCYNSPTADRPSVRLLTFLS